MTPFRGGKEGGAGLAAHGVLSFWGQACLSPLCSHLDTKVSKHHVTVSLPGLPGHLLVFELWNFRREEYYITYLIFYYKLLIIMILPGFSHLSPSGHD